MKSRRKLGNVTIRSNVVLEPDRWDLIPGEILNDLRGLRHATRLQHDEHMYYMPCSICRRTIVEINVRGCTQCPHAPLPEAVEKVQKAYRQRIHEALRREDADNVALADAARARAGRTAGGSR